MRNKFTTKAKSPFTGRQFNVSFSRIDDCGSPKFLVDLEDGEQVETNGFVKPSNMLGISCVAAFDSEDAAIIQSRLGKPTSKLSELEAKYPKAKLYLKADGYTSADNFVKSAAGDKAKQLLASSGTVEQAEEILNNWTKDVYID